jgi:hypothetical protein
MPKAFKVFRNQIAKGFSMQKVSNDYNQWHGLGLSCRLLYCKKKAYSRRICIKLFMHARYGIAGFRK